MQILTNCCLLMNIKPFASLLLFVFSMQFMHWRFSLKNKMHRLIGTRKTYQHFADGDTFKRLFCVDVDMFETIDHH